MLSAELNRSRQIGVEYEMTVPLVGTGGGTDIQRTLATVLSANGVRAIARNYSHDPVPSGVDVAVEYDSSVRRETRYQGISWHSVEIKSRILNEIDDWESVAPKVLEIARYMGCRVNASTGHDVHLALPEVADRLKVIRSLMALVTRIEPPIYGLVAPSRRNNTHCLPILGGQIVLRTCKTLADYYERLHSTSRFNGLNLTHVIGDSLRVEYRYHQGTLDAKKARHWLRFLLQVTEHAVTRNCQTFSEALVNDRKGFERMATAIGLRVNSKIYRAVCPELDETASYLLRRWKHFNVRPIPLQILRPQTCLQWPLRPLRQDVFCRWHHTRQAPGTRPRATRDRRRGRQRIHGSGVVGRVGRRHRRVEVEEQPGAARADPITVSALFIFNRHHVFHLGLAQPVSVASQYRPRLPVWRPVPDGCPAQRAT